MPRLLPDLMKTFATIQISDEQLYTLLALNDKRYNRRCNRTETPPTSEDWGLYHQAVRGKLAMEAYEGTDWGSPEADPEVCKPQPRVTYEWLETHDEWIERCHTLRQAEKES